MSTPYRASGGPFAGKLLPALLSGPCTLVFTARGMTGHYCCGTWVPKS